MMLCSSARTGALCSAVVMLFGCAAGGSLPTGTPVQNTAPLSLVRELRDLSLAASRSSSAHAGRGRSWMAPEAGTDDLLYVSNLQNVTVYSYPKGRHVGTLRGFYRPYAECTDSAGDVFIANQDTVVEYKHGGEKPIQTLTFSGYSSVGCASDPATGNLAVTWGVGFSNSYVAIYQHGSGTPTLYDNGTMLFNFCGYDDKGNLFVDGVTNHGDQFLFAELPKNGTSMTSINLDQTIGFGAAVQWDGKYVTVEDSDVSKIYRFAISGSGGTLKGTVNLEGATKYGLYQTWIDGKKVVGADILGDTVWYWKYPAGGGAIKSITKQVLAPYGVTISKAKT